MIGVGGQKPGTRMFRIQLQSLIKKKRQIEQQICGGMHWIEKARLWSIQNLQETIDLQLFERGEFSIATIIR